MEESETVWVQHQIKMESGKILHLMFYESFNKTDLTKYKMKR